MSSRGSTTAAVPASSSPTTYDAQPRSSWMNCRKTMQGDDHLMECCGLNMRVHPPTGASGTVIPIQDGRSGLNTRIEGPFRLSPQATSTDVLAKYFRGFGDPTRLRILDLLRQEERSVGELVQALRQPQPKVS